MFATVRFLLAHPRLLVQSEERNLAVSRCFLEARLACTGHTNAAHPLSALARPSVVNGTVTGISRILRYHRYPLFAKVENPKRARGCGSSWLVASYTPLSPNK